RPDQAALTASGPAGDQVAVPHRVGDPVRDLHVIPDFQQRKNMTDGEVQDAANSASCNCLVALS
ncbi:hypothetical protein PF008_g33126, partial [Phytophthora fragariae]